MFLNQKKKKKEIERREIRKGKGRFESCRKKNCFTRFRIRFEYVAQRPTSRSRTRSDDIRWEFRARASKYLVGRSGQRVCTYSGTEMSSEIATRNEQWPILVSPKSTVPPRVYTRVRSLSSSLPLSLFLFSRPLCRYRTVIIHGIATSAK